MVNWTQLFNRNERQDSSKDEWAEYTEKSLQDFMKSEFMQSFAEDCSQMLKDEGNEFYESYDTIKAKMRLYSLFNSPVTIMPLEQKLRIEDTSPLSFIFIGRELNKILSK